MQRSTKRRVVMRSAVVVVGSARRTTMKMDEARGGIKVFNGKESHKNDSNADRGERGYRRLRRNQSDSVTPCTPSKENALIERSAVKIRKASSDLSNSPTISTKQEQVLLLGDGNKCDGGEGKVEEEVEIEREEGDKSFVDKKMDQPEEKPMSVREQEEEEEDEEDEVNYENQDIPVPSQDAEKDQLPVSVSSMNVVESKQNPVTEHKAMNPDPAVLPHPEAAEEIFGSNSAKNNRMQSIANLVMWRDVSKSAFVFGSGTFFLVSSSYTNDINFSLISASSYVGLFYLGFAFLCKSILRRGETTECDERDERYMVGEEEAIWLLKLLLPYVNELLLKLRSLFSGDPATTLKLAVLLFVMARCGSSITIWSLAKLMFFGVFTIPKICSSYSIQLAKFGKFWLERLGDGWESCTHKKAVATAIFALVWNISSTVARIWAFFMVVVAVKLYQQCAAEHRWCGQEEEGQEDAVAGQSQGLGSHQHRGRNQVKREEKGVKVGDPRGGVGKRSK
ncbi:unnamed protein product [Musa acuminata var. zebrina]